MPPEGLMSGWEVQEKRKPSSPLSCEAFIRDDTKMLQRITVCWKLTAGKTEHLGSINPIYTNEHYLCSFFPPPNTKG